MALRIERGGEPLNLPEGFSTELEQLSPIFNEKGSQTVAVTIPMSRTNKRLCGYPGRIDNVSRVGAVDAVLSDGPYRRTCRMNVLSAGSDGVSLNFGIDESLVYEKWADVKLKDVPGWPVYVPNSSLSPAENTVLLIFELNDVYRGDAEADYQLFPVALEMDESSGGDTRFTFANEVYATPNAEPGSYRWGLRWSSRDVTFYSGSEETTVKVPIGYGITPFLRVGRVLALLFSAYGLTLEENPFETDYQLKRMVLLNNVADAIVAGKIDYAQLVPDCTVNELLQALYARTGAVVFVNGSTGKARIKLLKDILTDDPSDDWTLLQAGRMKIEFCEARQLKLSSATSYTEASPSEDSYERFMDKYSGVIDVKSGYSSEYTHPLLVLEYATGRIVKDIPVRTNSGTSYQKSFFSSSFFRWSKETKGVEEQDISGADECVPMRFVTVGGEEMLVPLYLSGVRNRYTRIKGVTSLSDDDPMETSTDLAFCFSHGEAKNTVGQSLGWYYGSSLCRNNLGRRFVDSGGNEYRYSLTYIGEDGAFNRFWKEYDAVLRYSLQKVTLPVNLGRRQLNNLDFSFPLMLHGQPMLAESVKQRLPFNGLPSESVLRTLKLLGNENQSADQDLRDIKVQPYLWQYFSTEHTTVEAYLDENYPPTMARWVEDFTMDSEVDVSEFMNMKEPTSADVESGKKLSGTFTSHVTFWIAYSGGGSNYEEHTVDLDFEAGYRAVSNPDYVP